MARSGLRAKGASKSSNQTRDNAPTIPGLHEPVQYGSGSDRVQLTNRSIRWLLEFNAEGVKLNTTLSVECGRYRSRTVLTRWRVFRHFFRRRLYQRCTGNLIANISFD